MQSVTSKIFMATLRMIFHSPLDESDSDRVYAKMKNANVDVELHKFEGMCHCFQLFSFLPESKTAYTLVKKRIMEDTK